ncbi:MAG TPA: hypothetical protein VKU01_23540 [Bryobacteraceae bacterium]|nr:hypothetical protein [Bryobacteraceae bacterium]
MRKTTGVFLQAIAVVVLISPACCQQPSKAQSSKEAREKEQDAEAIRATNARAAGVSRVEVRLMNDSPFAVQVKVRDDVVVEAAKGKRQSDYEGVLGSFDAEPFTVESSADSSWHEIARGLQKDYLVHDRVCIRIDKHGVLQHCK